MNRILATLLCLVASIVILPAAHAQKGLSIEQAFTPEYTMLPESTETLLKQSRLHNISLSLYRALSIAGNADKAFAVERMVISDGRRATSKEVRYSSGHLVYGLYVLPQRKGENRYILFLNGNLTGSGKMLLLYLEGEASVSDIKKLINKGNK